jgi:radical SAM-linked protein
MRLRIVFSKTGSLRYTGHLDMQVLWERTARRAGLPLSYTQGFHPGPKIQIASALPLGFVGRAEIVDLWVGEPLDPVAVRAALQPAAPPGLIVVSVEQVDERSPALQTQVVSADYEVALLDGVGQAELGDAIAALLAADSLPRERRGKAYDLRPLIESLSVLCPAGGQDGEEVKLTMRLAARGGATGRPEEVLDALGIQLEGASVTRTRLILKNGLE